MKIAFISTMSGFPWGGSEELWVKTAGYAQSSGHQIAISVVKWNQIHPKINALLNKGAVLDLRVLYNPGINFFSRVYNRINRYFFPIKYYEIIKNFEPDYIIISQGGTFDFVYDNHLQNLLIQLNKPYLLVCHSIPLNGQYLPLHLGDKAKFIFNRAKSVCFVAQKTKEIAEKNLLSNISNYSIIRNPVNLTSLEKLKNDFGSTIFFACVGSLIINYKGQDILLQVLNNEKWKARNWMLNIYGDGPDKEYLKRLIDYYNLQSKVILKGHTDNVLSIWKENNLLIMPSRLESAPLSLVEAMICGRPTVVTNVGGVSEWIVDGYNGFMADGPSVKLIDDALERAWQMLDKWDLVGECANKTALEKMDFKPEETLFNLLIN